MSLPDPDRADRQKVNEAVRRHDEARRAGRTVWLYLKDYQGGTSRGTGDPELVKVFGSAQGAEKWLEENDPEGVAWEYELEGGQAQQSIWLYAPNPSRERLGIAIGSSSSPPKNARKNGLRRTTRGATSGGIRFRSDADECVH
jgi:hypothetical protein